ncbi:unannotated protein [freshwater metagenome]|uniref:Unannotated protein n=1 Tax=freshwater metagenome TaxID=449393 RepID=A0A6J7K1U5_9ZZZZ
MSSRAAGSTVGLAATAASASESIPFASLMPRLTGPSTIGRCAKRSRPFTPMSAAKIATSAFWSSSADSGVEPAEPWVSTTISWPAAFAATSSDSAAM